MNSPSRFGTLGINIGFFGRWIRLIWGSLILVPLLVQSAQGIGAGNLNFYGLSFLYVLLILGVYTLSYYLLGARVLARSGLLNTVIFVAPAILTNVWNPIFSGPTGLVLPGSFIFAMVLYIGFSFILQWKLKYGGCEVVAVPILLLKKRYATYCVPLVAVDAVEKAVSDRKKSSKPDASA